jgi:hypothetical protein
MADASDTGAARARNGWLFAAIAIVSWSCWRFPQIAFNTRALDPSWEAALIYARKTGMQFGQDIVSTYGPLGYLSIECFSPYASVERLIFEVLFGVVIATGLCLLAWRIAWPWRVVMLGFFILVGSPLHWDGDALYADLGLFTWGLLCFLETGPRLRSYVSALVALAVVGAMVKITFLILGVLTIGLVACDLVLRGRRGLAAGMVFGFIFGFLIFWCLMGQNLSGLGRYLTTSLGVTSGYNAAMGLSEVKIIWVLLIVASAAAVVLGRALTFPMAGREPRCWWRVPLLLWLAAYLFEEWKYACVRSDWDHVAQILGIVPIMAIGMESLPVSGKRAMRLARAGCIVCLGAGIVFTQSQAGWLAPVKCVRRAGKYLGESAVTLVRPAHYLRERTEEFRAEQQTNQLPRIRAEVGDSSVDVFGQTQISAVFNELNYRPRPVFQSYAAYTRRMMDLNEEFYSSTNAPEYVLFDLRPIDHHFPPLEDAHALRYLLLKYEPVLNEANYLLLRRRSGGHMALALIREGNARLGEKVNLPEDPKGFLRLEVEFQPSAFDRVRAFLYRPRETELFIWKESDREPSLKYRAPMAMLSAGFLISPLALDNQQVLNIYTGAEVLRPSAFAVPASPGLLKLGASSIRYRIFRIER